MLYVSWGGRSASVTNALQFPGIRCPPKRNSSSANHASTIPPRQDWAMNAHPHKSPSLAVELLDLIARKVSHRRDLAQLSLASRTLRDVVLPLRTEFCDLESAVDDGNLWELLEANPLWVKAIRSLKLHITTIEDWRKVAQSPQGGHFPVNKRLFPLHLLGRMSRLQSFEWDSVRENGEAVALVSLLSVSHVDPRINKFSVDWRLVPYSRGLLQLRNSNMGDPGHSVSQADGGPGHRNAVVYPVQ